MGLIEDVISNSVSNGVQDAAGKMLAGNATNETVSSLNTVLTATLPRSSPIRDASWVIFFVAAALLLLYYITLSAFKSSVMEEVKEKYLNFENKSSRGPGAVIMLAGETLFITSQLVILATVAVLLRVVAINAMFPTTSTLLTLGTYGIAMIVLMAIAMIAAIFAFFIYAVYLVGGLALVKTLGLVWFLNPNSETTKKLLRLFWANQLFPLSLVLLIWFVQLVGIVFPFSMVMMPVIPIFISFWACLLLYLIHTLAWDWDPSMSMGRYRSNVTWVTTKVGFAAAAGTGNPGAIIAATAVNAASSGGSVETAVQQRGIKKR